MYDGNIVSQPVTDVNTSRLTNDLTRQRRATHCPNGHAYPADVRYSKDGYRVCRACAADRARRHRHAQPKQAAPTAPRPLRTHCKHKHEYTPTNTRYAKNGTRVCCQCLADRRRRYDQAKKNAALDLAKLPLPPLALTTALYLQANARRPVTHEEIVTRGWQRVFLPSDKNNVEVQINKIRKALGDTSSPRRYLDTRTAQRISAYVWIGPVQQEAR